MKSHPLFAVPVETPAEVEALEAVQAAIARLKDDEREALTLFYRDRLTIDQIADRLLISPSGVDRLLRGARRKIAARVLRPD